MTGPERDDPTEGPKEPWLVLPGHDQDRTPSIPVAVEVESATRLSIRTKLAIAAVGVFTITMAGGLRFLLAAQTQEHLELQEERLGLLSDILATGLANHVRDGSRPEDFQRHLSDLWTNGRQRAALVEVLDLNQTVVASTSPERVGERRPLPVIPDGEPPLVHEELRDEWMLTLVSPLFDPDDEVQRRHPLHFLAVSTGQAPLEAAVSGGRRTIIWTLAVTLVLQLIATWIGLTVLAVRPIREMVSVMHRVEKGDLSLRVSERLVADEFNWLARTFNSMVSRLKETQRALDSYLRERMIRADRFATIGELSSGLVHEIKNPLASIWGALQILEGGYEDAETRTKVIGLMKEQIQRVDRTLRDLQRFAQPSPPELKAVDPNELLDRVLLLVRQHHSAASAKLTKRFLATQRIRGDLGQLEQAFMSLCLNAAQAMPSGGELEVASRDEGDRVVLEIRDNGPGIPLELRDKIFKPFFTTKARGTGLGLTIAAQIVAEHGGELTFECPKEGGTRFCVRLGAAAPEVPVRGPSQAGPRLGEIAK